MCEEAPRVIWIDESQILVQDAFPSIVHIFSGLCATVTEVGVPLFLYEFLGAYEGGARQKREHVDALDGVEVAVEERGVVAFVFEELYTQ